MLGLSRAIDRFSEFVGRTLMWLVLVMTLISAANAAVRKVFNVSSNAYLEIQWYLFAAIFLLAAGYTLLRQEHVRIDVVLSRWSRRTQVKIELFGTLFFLLPLCVLVVWLVWPLVAIAYASGEISGNAGGLIRWPVYALVPLGFLLLGLQGVSEAIKRIAFLQGRGPDPGIKPREKSAEEELADEIRARDEQAAAAAASPASKGPAR